MYLYMYMYVYRVSLVMDVLTKETYALKTMLKNQIVAQKQQKNVLNEKMVMMRCNHPFILRYIYMYIYMDMFIYLYTYVFVYIYMNMYIYIYKYIYIYVYVYT
jgi:serine/threonine protein kinase